MGFDEKIPALQQQTWVSLMARSIISCNIPVWHLALSCCCEMMVLTFSLQIKVPVEWPHCFMSKNNSVYICFVGLLLIPDRDGSCLSLWLSSQVMRKGGSSNQKMCSGVTTLWLWRTPYPSRSSSAVFQTLTHSSAMLQSLPLHRVLSLSAYNNYVPLYLQLLLLPFHSNYLLYLVPFID